jgi:orotidine-5'-phosphate decarboxylase
MVGAEGGEVFLDLKFHDIPNTVAAAIRAAAELDVFLCNVHASGGFKMMQEAAKAARESGNEKLQVIAVTVLTSMSSDDLKQIGVAEKADDQVLALAQLAKDAGLSGVVCSGQEAAAVRHTCGKDFLIVTPGVRPAWASKGDQARVVTPQAAFASGADYIVVGRPVTAAPDPLEAAEKILNEI